MICANALFRRSWAAKAVAGGIAVWRCSIVGGEVVAAVSRHRSVRPDKMGGHRKPVLDAHRAFILERLKRTPHLTLHGLKDELAMRGVTVSHNAVWLFLRREGLRFKKTLLGLEQGRSDIVLRRRRWRSWQGSLDPHRLVFIDETWIKTNMAPLRGWGPKGDRAPGFAPHGYWRTLTFVGALRCDQLTAPCVFDGPINGECFRAYVEEQLVPLLKPGDIVIMDNLGSHKSATLRRIIRAAGARLWYLPPYSPDLNPIEQAFAKVKHWMRIAQKRTIDDVWRHIGTLVASINANECNNYFANAGYASVKA
jgi:transposase